MKIVTQLCKTSCIACCSRAVRLCGTYISCCKASAQCLCASKHMMLDFFLKKKNNVEMHSISWGKCWGVEGSERNSCLVKAWDL